MGSIPKKIPCLSKKQKYLQTFLFPLEMNFKSFQFAHFYSVKSPVLKSLIQARTLKVEKVDLEKSPIQDQDLEILQDLLSHSLCCKEV